MNCRPTAKCNRMCFPVYFLTRKLRSGMSWMPKKRHKLQRCVQEIVSFQLVSTFPISNSDFSFEVFSTYWVARFCSIVCVQRPLHLLSFWPWDSCLLLLNTTPCLLSFALIQVKDCVTQTAVISRMLVIMTKSNANRPCSKVVKPPKAKSLLCYLKTCFLVQWLLLFEEYFCLLVSVLHDK